MCRYGRPIPTRSSCRCRRLLVRVVARSDQADVARELWPEALVVLDALPQSVGGKVAKQVLRDDAARQSAGPVHHDE